MSPGSLREGSFSRKLANECARLLELMGADATWICSVFTFLGEGGVDKFFRST